MFALTLALTLVLAAWSVQRHADERRAALAQRADTFRVALGGAVRSQLELLPSLRLVASGPLPLDDARFARYVDSVLGANRHPGLLLTFVADRVDAAGIEAYVDSVRADRSTDPAGHPSFQVQPAGARPEYMLLRHQHPADATNDGYDLYDPTQQYRQAVENAIAAGGLVATAPLRLARDRHRPDHPELSSIVVRAAFYRGGRPPDGAEARQAAAGGVVGIAFRSAALVRSALPAGLVDLARVRITDAGAPLPVYDSRPGAAAPAAAALAFDVPVADRRWRVELAPPHRGWWQDAGNDTLVLLAAGGGIAAALAALVAGLNRGRPGREAGDGRSAAPPAY